MRFIILSCLMCLFLIADHRLANAEPTPLCGPELQEAIRKVDGLKLVAGSFGKDGPFAGAGNRQVVVLRSLKQARTYFDKESMVKLEKSIDFKKQTVLLFAWQGSGQDQLGYEILKSLPVQIHFNLAPGRTRDLRQHFRVFALRNNVRWKSEFKKKKPEKRR